MLSRLPSSRRRLRRAPVPLELAYRYAVVDPRTGTPRDLRKEQSFAVNYYLEGHDNKLTFDVSCLTVERLGEPWAGTTRYRVQYDVRF